MKIIIKRLFLFALFVGINFINILYAQYEVNNDFIPDAFPGNPDSKIFSIPLNPGELIVVVPDTLKSNITNLQLLLSKKSGKKIEFHLANDLSKEDIRKKHLIIIGNISNNQWTLELYKQRYAFADSYFPGKDGVIIHPSSSIWNPEKNVLVIGVSSDSDLVLGFERFVDLLENGADTINTMHYLKTLHQFPDPPTDMESIFEPARRNEAARALYHGIANWGFLYFLTGDTKWAEYFRDGFYVCHERAKTSGQWIPEYWSLMYFFLWNMFIEWELLDDDPFFTMDDRKIIEEVLWGYTQFARGRPYLNEEYAPLYEPRQNHSTFLALSLYHAHRYYTEKYGITGLDSMADKFNRAFNDGQAYSYRPNDDGGAGYQVLVPSHHLSYTMAEGDDSFLASGRLGSVADLMVATFDNRRDPVTFGDLGSYSHRKKGAPQVAELKFFKMAAWYYGDGQYQWLYNWMSRDCLIDLDVWGAFATGLYAVDIQEEEPTRYVGVFPVMLDDASLRWSARRSEKKASFPLTNKRYFDKISFRSSFNPQDEYLLLDGTSTFAHGHQDGNTITRLTWKDKVWLFDADYIKSTPRYHNGVIVVRDGVQGAPPPLNTLDYAADFNSIGFTQTTSKDFNGADWERNIIWKKGKYFLFLDRVKALKSGDYRIENRWRTRGDVKLDGNVLSVQQGDNRFYIKSADEASRKVVMEPDGYGSVWDYPYGNGKMSICLARKNLAMAQNSEWIFANLMYAVDDSDTNPIELNKISDDLFLIKDSENQELVGLRPEILEAEGIYTDCSLFFKNAEHTWFIDASRLKFEDVSFEAPENVHIEINYLKSTGKIVIPEGSGGLFHVQNLFFKDVMVQPGKNNNTLKLNPGTYDFTLRKDSWKNEMTFKTLVHTAHKILPESPSNRIVDFGIEIIQKIDVSDTITSFYPDGSELIFADKKGRMKKYDGKNASLLFRIPSQRPIKSVHAADINGDGKAEIIAGDDSENLYCHNSAGKLLWEHKLRPFMKYTANAVDITSGITGISGKPTILVTTESWKLFAFHPDGTLKWESFIYYHPLTKVKILKNKNSQPLIAVGTTYQTPLNIVNPDDGKVIWFTWEQVGSESNSTTDYCGKHLTDMVFVDTDKDGEKEIVFGTKHHRVYALNAADGSTKWDAAVGDEVTVMKEMEDPLSNDKRILVATDGGELVLLDRSGKRLNMISVESGISDIKILTFPQHNRVDIILSTNDGRVIICDNDFLIRASVAIGNAPVKGIILGEKSGEEYQIYSVSDNAIHLLKYHPYFLKKSRHY